METPDLIRFISDGVDRAKAGDALPVYAEVVPYIDRGELPPRSHYACGWIVYYAMHQSAANAIDERKRMLARYLKLNVPKPHKLHSMVLTQAIRLHKDAREAASVARRNNPRAVAPDFSLVKFCALWDLANLRPGDWKRKEQDGKPLGSTVEKLITRYVDELEGARGSVEIPADFMAVMERAMQEFGDSDSLLSQRATLHLLAGEREAALGLLRNAVIAAPGKFFLWSRLASLVDVSEAPRVHVALLYKALRAPGQENFKGKVHTALAEAWLRIGNFPFAAWEMQRVKELYTANGWHLSPRFKEMEQKLPAGTAPLDPSDVYKSVEPLADDFVYEALPHVKVVKTYHKPATPGTDRYGRNRPGMVAWRVTDEGGTNYWFNPVRHGLQEDLPQGTVLMVKLHNGKVVKAALQGEATA